MAEYQNHFQIDDGNGDRSLYLKYLGLASSNDEEPNKLKIVDGKQYYFVSGISGRLVKTNYQQVPGRDNPETLACFDTFVGESYEKVPEEKFVLHFADVNAEDVNMKRPIQVKRPLYQHKSLEILMQLATFVQQDGWTEKDVIFAIKVDNRDRRYNKIILLDAVTQKPIQPLFSFDELKQKGLISTDEKPLTTKIKDANRTKLIDSIVKSLKKTIDAAALPNLPELYAQEQPTQEANTMPDTPPELEDDIEEDLF